MTKYIGNYSVSAIESVDLSTSRSSEEFEIVENNERIFVDSSDLGEDISLSVVIIDDEQGQDINELTEQEYSDNDFLYEDIIGFISVDSVNIPEQSSQSGIRNGEIEGKILPWPEYNPELDFSNVRPSDYQIKGIETNSPVLQGETLQVDSLIKNEGFTGKKQVDLNILNSSDSSTEKIKYTSSKNVEFLIDLPDGEFGDFTGTVSTPDDEESFSVLIEELKELFVIESVTTNSPIKETETLVVEVSILNDGNQTGTQEVLLSDFSSSTVDSSTITLNSGNEQNVELQWETQDGDSGQGNIRISTENDEFLKNIEIKDLVEAFFDVSIISTNSPVSETETLEVTVSVQNTGEKSAEKEIRLLDFDSNIVDTALINLSENESKEVVLQWETEYGDEAESEIVVDSDDSSDAQTVQVDIGF